MPKVAFPAPLKTDRTRSQAMLAELGRYVVAEPWSFAVDLERSRGMWLATVDGDKLHDWAGLYGSRLLGYNHTRLSEPAYLSRLALAANNKMANPDFLTQECLDFYRLLHRLSPRCMRSDKLEVYAVNSGAEAVENMIKYLINMHLRKRRAQGVANPGRKLIWFEGAFHGRTVLTLNITELDHDPLINRDYRGMIGETFKAPFPAWVREAGDAANEAESDRCLAAIRKIFEDNPGQIAAVVAEPMQGAGGHRIATPGFFAKLSELVHEHDSYLAFDEVQTSGGTCGDIFMCDLLDLPHPPQGVAVAKKFGCGAVFMKESMEDIGILDSTWGGNLCDMVRVVHEYKIVEEERLLEQVEEKTQELLAGLLDLAKKHPDYISNVRGYGLYQGFSCKTPQHKQRLAQQLMDAEQTFILGAGPGGVRLRPPIDVESADIQRLIRSLDKACTALEQA